LTLGNVVSVPKTRPWHDPGDACYHEQTECAFGAEIPLDRRVEGDGDKELCRVCASLERADQRLEA
jgi:hypothetical protein